MSGDKGFDAWLVKITAREARISKKKRDEAAKKEADELADFEQRKKMSKSFEQWQEYSEIKIRKKKQNDQNLEYF